MISIDTKELEGLLALLQSLKKHTTEAVVTYIISSSEDIEEISTAVKCAFLISDKFQVYIQSYLQLRIAHTCESVLLFLTNVP